MKFSAIIY